MSVRIGITDYFDAGLDQSWLQYMNQVAGAILITKAPHQLLEVQIPANTVIHCTITGWGGSRMEPGVQPMWLEIMAYAKLIELFGPERVVLRVDPIFPTEMGFKPAAEVLCHARGRVRISFLDGYAHARQRIKATYGTDLPWQGFHAPLAKRQALLERCTQILGFQPEICGEPGLPCTGCISERDIAAMGLSCKLSGKCGQRKDCHCAGEKWEFLGARKRCSNRCLYCFWRD